MPIVDQLVPAANPWAMRLAQLSAMSDALSLAFAVRQALSKPTVFHVAEDGWTITVEGHLNLSHDDIVTRLGALCTFVIPMTWRKRLPSIWCREQWGKRALPGGVTNAEWHVLADDSLCYELPHRWLDQMAQAEQIGGVSAALELAREWMLNSARWLIYRHLEAFRRDLTHWDNERWPAWGHYRHGPREYLLMKQRARRSVRQSPLLLAA